MDREEEKKQKILERLLAGVGRVTRKTIKRPSRDDLERSPHHEAIAAVYRDLGGALSNVPCQPGPWDVEFDGIAVELDEELHFNCYRAVTLRSPLYDRLQSFPLAEYREYSSRFADRCLKAGAYGKKWSSPSSEMQFGSASAPGTFSNGGSPRWKQRAFYDLVKDSLALLTASRMARVAIWDEIDDGAGVRTVLDILADPRPSSAESLAGLIRDRAG